MQFLHNLIFCFTRSDFFGQTHTHTHTHRAQPELRPGARDKLTPDWTMNRKLFARDDGPLGKALVVGQSQAKRIRTNTIESDLIQFSQTLDLFNQPLQKPTEMPRRIHKLKPQSPFERSPRCKAHHPEFKSTAGIKSPTMSNPS